MNFPPTRLSVVARTRSEDHETRRLAFGTLIEAYWKPTYKYLRLKWKLDPDAAADLTQEFFTNALEKDVLARYDAERACSHRWRALRSRSAGRSGGDPSTRR